MTRKEMLKKEMKIRFLKNWISYKGQRVPVRYFKGPYTKESGISEGTISIYAKTYKDSLPAELNPENDTEIQTDYFEKDRARIKPNSPYYKDVLKQIRD